MFLSFPPSSSTYFCVHYIPLKQSTFIVKGDKEGVAFVWNVGNHCWSHKSSRISLRRRFFYTTLLVIKELPVLESFFTICAKIFSSAINSCGKWQVTEFMRFFTLCTHLHSGQKCLKNTTHPGIELKTYSKGIGSNPNWGKVFLRQVLKS